MICIKCHKEYDPDELDGDKLCYNCANFDPDYSLDLNEEIKELLENIFGKLAVAKNTTSENIKNKFVVESITSSLPAKKPVIN